jgi:heat shock protein HslJ
MRVHRLVVAVLVLAGLAVAGCDAATPAPSGSTLPTSAFVGPDWGAIAIRGLAPVPGHEPRITFGPGSVRGTGGCNGFSGAYRYDAATGAIAFDQLAMTAMGCLQPGVGGVETAFSDALARADHLAMDADGRLHLTGAGGEVVLAKLLEG